MSVAPVGIRCPDHAGGRRQTPKPVRSVQRTAARRGFVIPTQALMTRILVAVNVGIYLITVAQGSGLNSPGGHLFYKWVLFGPSVANGEWWRLITSTFLHANLLHIGFNMYALWWLGSQVELALGRWRFLLLYLVSGLAGSAGALVWNPNAITVGASGAIFGLLGAGLILEYRTTGRLAGPFLTLIIINLVITFAFSSFISAGGHVGGLIAGILGASVIMARGRFREAWDAATIVGLVGIGVLSVAIAYLKVRGYS